jgi:lipoate-protein ligase A
VTDAAVGPRAPGWEVHHHEGSAAQLHALELPVPAARAVWVMSLTRDALVLGSTQSRSLVDPAVLDGDPLDVTTRRTGGGAVLLRSAGSLWIDVVVPRDDELWTDDVGRSFDWLGAAWIRALLAVGVASPAELEVFPGPLRRTAASDLVCFAGLGPGEVTVQGRKAVGLSQRRSRAGARFQCLAYVGETSGAEAIVALLAEPTDAAARAQLESRLAAEVAVLPVAADALVTAFVDALPA